MNDLISRQAAIDALKAMAVPLYKDLACEDIWERDRTLDNAIDAIRGLSSAQPERKKGKWIPYEDEDGEHYGDKCSECGEWYVMPYGKTNFCPHCGAEMEKGEDDDTD